MLFQVTGMLHLVAHERQSYDVYLILTAPPLQPGFPPQQVRFLLPLISALPAITFG